MCGSSLPDQIVDCEKWCEVRSDGSSSNLNRLLTNTKKAIMTGDRCSFQLAGVTTFVFLFALFVASWRVTNSNTEPCKRRCCV